MSIVTQYLRGWVCMFVGLGVFFITFKSFFSASEDAFVWSCIATFALTLTVPSSPQSKHAPRLRRGETADKEGHGR